MKKRTINPFIVMLWLVVIPATILSTAASQAQPPSAEEARAIAKEAYIYGFPLVDNYRIQYAYYVDTKNPEFKAPWNTIKSIPRVYTPEDKTIQTPNSDTPYSMAGLDLRSEPFVLTVPRIDKSRYFSVQLIDSYTFNFAYIGSRATGNDGGSFLVAGPNWKGETPKGIAKLFRSESQIVLCVYRTQLLSPGDIDNVKKIQAGYQIQPLSAFLGQPAPKPAPKVDFIRPLTPDEQKTSLDFFRVLNFVLQFTPTHSSEEKIMARFGKIGVGAGKAFDPAKLSPAVSKSISDGMADAWKELQDFERTSIATGKVTSGELFGTREFLKNNYLHRFAGTVLGIYGNSKLEAMYPIYQADGAGEKLDASKNRYILRFAPNQLPPVNAFWSLTMYELPASLLVANKLNRYLINSPMLPELKRDSDGGLTLYIQHESPGADKESNWLPAPNGTFMAALRLYWPKPDAIEGRWKAPSMQRVK